jgi:hypothetical protein
MTVCVGVRVNDCMVFAADSASSLVTTDPATGQSQILNVYSHGEKVFNLYRHLPVCAMTCGMGNIGTDSISTLAKALRQKLMSHGDPAWELNPNNYTVEQIAVAARKFLFEEKFQQLAPVPPAPHSLEFWVGGYPSDREAPHEVWKITIVNGQCDAPAQEMSPGETGIFWGGQPGPIHRLVTGFDPALEGALLGSGMDANAVAAIASVLRPQLTANLVAPTMPIRDAIELADFLVETTKRYFRFLPGADIVGGETDIAVVTKYEGFKWIRRKHFYSRELNALETDHAC